MGNKSPIVIEVSELILRALIMDKEMGSSDWFNHGNLKLVYGSVIIRLVCEEYLFYFNS